MAKALSLWMVTAMLVGLARRSLAWSSGPRAIQLMSARGALAVESRASRAAARSRYKVEQQHLHPNFNGLQVCVWIDSTPSGEQQSSRSGPFCFDKEEHDLPIEGLEVGSHRLSAAVIAPGEPARSMEPRVLSPVANTEFEVVLQKQFSATYDWQDVQEWHSLPAGLHIVLPLDGVGKKRARIPPVWQLQKYVEFSGGDGGISEGIATAKRTGGFFLRADVRPETTVLELRREIARHPRVARRGIDCVELSWGGRVLNDVETVESLDLFNRLRDLAAVVVDRTVG